MKENDMTTPIPTDDSMLPADCWFQAPDARSSEFFPIFSRVSVALFQSLRKTIPAIALSDISAYDDRGLAHAMLIYRASRPNRPQPRADFTYDVLNPKSMTYFCRMAHRSLPTVLRETCALLKANGRPDLVKYYHPEETKPILHAARTHRTVRVPLNKMLVTEGLMLHELIHFADTRATTPNLRFGRRQQFERRWTTLLNHFCREFPFTAAGPIALQAATDALISARRDYELEQQNAQDPHSAPERSQLLAA